MTFGKTVKLAVALAAVAIGLAGCGQGQGNLRICGDGHGRRLADSACSTGAGWIYIRGGKAPAVGGTITDGTRTPDDGVSYSAAPVAGVGGQGTEKNGQGMEE